MCVIFRSNTLFREKIPSSLFAQGLREYRPGVPDMMNIHGALTVVSNTPVFYLYALYGMLRPDRDEEE